ncbi:OLC1v1015981C1 [Oldenlandia corymbosa var. corymbosa]|uniref:OLC1v1015981C1 n=1 Tax=Oldenlandia corymbosa var. corymbosa TaxID=529605 RepID=A0AAV1E5F7_OLDCO|nr:OLC1v1015981C1 [Oldenlandia corymbosa var. corymbosa]
MELPEGTLTLYKKQKPTQEEQSPVQTPSNQNLWRKPKRKKSTPAGNPKQLVVADDNDDKKPKKKRMKPENNKLIIGQDPWPISSEDSVKKFETRMTPNHLFQLITEINKPTDLTKEPDAVDYRQLQRQAIRDMGFGALLDLKIKNIPTALCNFLASNFQTGARQVPLNGNNVLDTNQEDVVAVLDLPCGPIPVQEFKQNDPAITDHAEMVDAFKKRMGYSNKFLPTRSTAAQLIASRKDFGDDFKRDFLDFVVSTFLHGNTTSRITMNILKSLVNINEVTQYNWCQYVIDALVKGCKSHHDGKPFTGPITFFLLCYLDRCEYERAHPRSFPVIKSWDQRMLDDRIRLQGSNFTDVQTLERLKKPSSATSRDEQPEAESQKEDTQGIHNTQQVYDLAALYEKFYQLIITMSKTVLDIREKEMELRIEPDEQAKQTIKILSDAMVSMSRKMPPPSGTTQQEQEQQQHQQDLQDAQICELCEMAWKSAESRFATIIEQLQRQVADQQEQQQHQQTNDNTVEAPINLAKFQDIETDKAQGLEQLSQTNDEASIAVGKTVPTSKEVVVDEPQTQLQGAQGLDQLSQTNDENSLPVGKSVPTSKEVRVDEKQTQPREHATNVSTTEKKRSHQDSTGQDSAVTSTYTKRSRSTGTRKRKALKDVSIPSFNLGIFSSQEDSYETTQEKNTQEDVTVTVDLDKDVNETIEAEEYPVPSALDETKNPIPSIDEIITRASAPASETSSDTEKLEIIAAVAEQVEKNPEDTISRYYQQDSNKEEIEFTFYERLALELEEQGLSVGSLIVAKAIYFPVHYREHYFLYVLLVQEKKVLAFNNLHAKDLDYYKPTKDLLFRFFKMYIQCVIPNIELVNAQLTFTEVTLPSHNDKKPNAEDCGIFTMHHMEKYDGGDYEDGTTLDFHTGNIKEYRWRYMLKILIHPSNKNKDKILEAMHQFYTNTAEEEPKEIPDHVDLSSKSYYNDKKIQGRVK